MNLDQLRNYVLSCQDCPLHVAGRGVPGTWRGTGKDSGVMFIGEAPGGTEQEMLEPFVGRAGTVLGRLIEEAGINRYYITNMVKHRPPKVGGKQTAPEASHMQACSTFLYQEIAEIDPKHIVLLGKTAAKLVVPGNFSMNDVQGQHYEYEGHDVVVTWHPAAFLYTTQPRRQTTMMNQTRRTLASLVGDEPEPYDVEKVVCPKHSPFYDVVDAIDKVLEAANAHN